MRRLVAAIAIFVLAGCGSSPTSPAPTPGAPVVALNAFEGIWLLDHKVAECSGERHCSLTIGRVDRFSLRLLNINGSYSGVLLLPSANIDLQGTVDAEGTLVLSGVRPAPENSYAYEVTRLRLRNEAGTLTGDLEWGMQGPSNAFIFGRTRRSGPLTSVTKAAEILALDQGFTGTWKGQFVPRDCVVEPSQRCPLNTTELWEFELTLTHDGGRMTGTLRRPGSGTLEGIVSSGTIVLQGAGDGIDGGRATVTYPASTLTRDKLGRLRGSLSIEMQSYWSAGDRASYKIELVDVVLTLPGS